MGKFEEEKSLITFCSINEVEAEKEAIKSLEKEYPNVYKNLVEVVHLTHALNFKFHFMGALIMDEDPGQYLPNTVHKSVLRLYKKELQTLKQNQDFHALKQIFSRFKNNSYTNISLLILGIKPEALVGASFSR
jgi:hypothetical protein